MVTKMEAIQVVNMYQTHKIYFKKLKKINDKVAIEHGTYENLRTNCQRYMRTESKFIISIKKIDGKIYAIAKDNIENWKVRTWKK